MRQQGGFSLLEVLVAFSIMGMALAALYNVVGGSARATQRIEQASRAAIVARSVLALYPYAPESGLNAHGSEADGLSWQVSSEPYVPPLAKEAPRRLQQLRIVVSWEEAGQPRERVLHVLVPEVKS